MSPPTSPARHYRALVLDKLNTPLTVKSKPLPLAASPGTAVIRILAAPILSYHGEICAGTRAGGYDKIPVPDFVPGCSAVGRVALVAPDAAAGGTLREGQLVFMDCTVRPRDKQPGDPGRVGTLLIGVHPGGSGGSRRLMADEWRHGSFAEYCRVPAENCFPLDEERLCGSSSSSLSSSLGYTPAELAHMATLTVPFGGLRSVGVEPGETVAVFPATGNFGAAGVQVALAMGANVVAVGRSPDKLARLGAEVEHQLRDKGGNGGRFRAVELTGDVSVDTKAMGTLDAVLDLTPPEATESTHLKSMAMALRHGGRVSLMGAFPEGVGALSGVLVVGNDLQLRGKLMYTREDVVQFIRMLESGLFARGRSGEGGYVEVRPFPLERWEEAFTTAAKFTGFARSVMFIPQQSQ